MKKWSSYLMATIVFSLVGCGGAEAPVESSVTKDQPSVQTAPSKVFLWKAVSTGNPAKTVYLLGSVHVGSEEFYPLPRVVEEAYERSEKLVVEVDTLAQDSVELQQRAAALSMLPSGQTLKGLLSGETWDKLTAFLNQRGVPVVALEQLKPWAAAIAITALRLQKQGFDAKLGIDVHFLARRDKEIVELESLEYQLGLFDGLSAHLQETMLLDVLEGPLQTDASIASMMAAWKRGDSPAMVKLMEKEFNANPGFLPLYQKIVVERNHKMAESILALLDDAESLFVVVGALHVVGDEGLAALLEQSGFEVRQLEDR